MTRTLIWTGRATCSVTFHKDTHSLDLLAFSGHSICSCWHFTKHFKPVIEEQIKRGTFEPGDARLECAHIEFCNRELLKLFKQQLAASFPDTDHEVT